MYRAEDAIAGYGQRWKKPSTSILPYLRAREAEKEEAGRKPASPKPNKDKAEKMEKKKDAGADQYDKVRLEILRG